MGLQESNLGRRSFTYLNLLPHIGDGLILNFRLKTKPSTKNLLCIHLPYFLETRCKSKWFSIPLKRQFLCFPHGLWVGPTFKELQTNHNGWPRGVISAVNIYPFHSPTKLLSNVNSFPLVGYCGHGWYKR